MVKRNKKINLTQIFLRPSPNKWKNLIKIGFWFLLIRLGSKLVFGIEVKSLITSIMAALLFWIVLQFNEIKE